MKIESIRLKNYRVFRDAHLRDIRDWPQAAITRADQRDPAPPVHH